MQECTYEYDVESALFSKQQPRALVYGDIVKGTNFVANIRYSHECTQKCIESKT